MTLTCPQCGFSRNLDPAAVPPRAVRARCPRCGAKVALDALGSETAAPAPGVETAGLGARVPARLVDALLCCTFRVPASLLLAAWIVNRWGGWDETAAAITLTVIPLFWVCAGIAYAAFFTGYCGQTPGKMLLRLRVDGADGLPLGYRRALRRETLGRLFALAPLGAGYLMILFDENRQGLHDKLVASRVVRL